VAENAAQDSVKENAQLIQKGDSTPPGAVSQKSIALGEKLYKRKCIGCHSVDKNRIGPRHRGVYGRAAGAVTDYKYSKALKNLDVIWTDATLDLWLENPTAMAKGTSMGFRLKKPQERSAIIHYLKSLSTGGSE
jgi:cytochrome c